MALGGVIGIKISAEDAELRAVMKSAAQATTTAFSQMQGAASLFQRTLGGIGVGLSIREMFQAFNGAIDAADQLNDLSKKTAISVETLSGLRLAAEQSGTSMEAVAKGLAKLGKAQKDASDGNEKLASLFKALEVDSRRPEEALLQLAKAFEGLSEEGRVEVADRLGKGFRELIPLLSEGADGLQKMIDAANRLNPITTESARAADRYKDSTAALGAAANGFWIAMAEKGLPSMIQISEQMLISARDGGIFKGVLDGLRESFVLLFQGGTQEGLLAEKIAKTKKDLADVQAQIDSGLLKPPGKDNGMFSFLVPQVQLSAADKAKLKSYIAKTQGELQVLLNEQSTFYKPPQTVKTPEKTGIGQKVCELSGGRWNGTECVPAAEVQALQKKILDQTIRGLDNQIGAEKDGLQERNSLLDLYNSENLISMEHFFGERKRAQDEALANQLKYYDDQITAIKEYQAALKGPNTDAAREEAQTRINDILDKQRKLRDQARVEDVTAPIRQAKAIRELADKIGAINTSILEYGGNLREAAAIRFDQSTFELRLKLTTENNQAGLEALRIQRQQVIAQAELNTLSRDASILSDQRMNAESAITLAQANGIVGELDSLRLRTEARRKQIADLEIIYQTQLAIANASGNPRLIQDARNLGAELARLRDEADLVKKAFDDIFVGSFTDSLAGFISGTKSAKEAFKDFVNSVVQQLSRLAAQDIARSLFGGGSSGGSTNLFGKLLGLFGSGAAGAGGGADAGSVLAQFGSGWAGPYAKGGVFDQDGVQKFAGGGVFAKPTNFRFAGGVGLMGEAGPEAVMPLARDRSGRLGVRGSGSVMNNVTFNISTPDANSFRQSESQIAARMYRALSRSNRSR